MANSCDVAAAWRRGRIAHQMITCFAAIAPLRSHRECRQHRAMCVASISEGEEANSDERRGWCGANGGGAADKSWRGAAGVGAPPSAAASASRQHLLHFICCAVRRINRRHASPLAAPSTYHGSSVPGAHYSGISPAPHHFPLRDEGGRYLLWTCACAAARRLATLQRRAQQKVGSMKWAERCSVATNIVVAYRVVAPGHHSSTNSRLKVARHHRKRGGDRAHKMSGGPAARAINRLVINNGRRRGGAHRVAKRDKKGRAAG